MCYSSVSELLVPFFLVNYSRPNSFLAFRLSSVFPCLFLQLPRYSTYLQVWLVFTPLQFCVSPIPEAPRYLLPHRHTFPTCAVASFSELWPSKSLVGNMVLSSSLHFVRSFCFSSGLWTLKVVFVCVSNPVALLPPHSW